METNQSKPLAKFLRWIIFLPVGAILVGLAQIGVVTTAESMSWWLSAPLIIFFGVIPAGAGLIPTLIAPNRKIGATILLTLFILFEVIALLSSFTVMALYPFIMRVYADIAIIVGATSGVIYYERTDG
jgi:hypothetical protein